MSEKSLPAVGGQTFEDLKQANAHGAEYWSARDLQSLLGYSQWRRFEQAIKRAKTSCKESGNSPDHHFAGAGKPITGGKGAVRNLERQPEASFWLPTSTDRFYPDFVAELTDGRVLVIEYKGAHLYDGSDAREKRDIGKVWAAASDGRCLFAMVTDAEKAGKSVTAQLKDAIRN